ncbi:MAG: efflux RND transporter periplasmic adaptor subunit [Acidobacteriota bacterium]
MRVSPCDRTADAGRRLEKRRQGAPRGRSLAGLGLLVFVCGCAVQDNDAPPVPDPATRGEVAPGPTVGPETGADGGVRVRAARLRPLTRSREVTLPGSFEPYERALLHSRVDGYVRQVKVDIGSRIRKGDPLVVLEVPGVEAELAKARADRQAAEARLLERRAAAEQARITHHRFAGLAASEPMAVTPQEVDAAGAGEKVAMARVKVAEAEIEVARAEESRLETLESFAVIRAPFDGMVARRLVDTGALVVQGADGGEPVLEVARTDHLRLVVHVPEALVPEVGPGLPARVEVDALPGRDLRVPVSRCAGALRNDTRTMRAELDVDPEGTELRPGMYATVHLELKVPTGRLDVPAAAVRRTAEGAFLWAVRDGKAHKVAVDAGGGDGALTVQGDGVEEGMLVVLNGGPDLREGQFLQVEEQGREP